MKLMKYLALVCIIMAWFSTLAYWVSTFFIVKKDVAIIAIDTLGYGATYGIIGICCSMLYLADSLTKNRGNNL